MSSADPVNFSNAAVIPSTTFRTDGMPLNTAIHFLIASMTVFAPRTSLSNPLVIISFSFSQSRKATITSPTFPVTPRISVFTEPNISPRISKAALKPPPTTDLMISRIANKPSKVLLTLSADSPPKSILSVIPSKLKRTSLIASIDIAPSLNASPKEPYFSIRESTFTLFDLRASVSFPSKSGISIPRSFTPFNKSLHVVASKTPFITNLLVNLLSASNAL